jgi:hypothetical protein
MKKGVLQSGWEARRLLLEAVLVGAHGKARGTGAGEATGTDSMGCCADMEIYKAPLREKRGRE